MSQHVDPTSRASGDPEQAERRWDMVFSDDLKPGAVIGSYQIISVLGEGGFGVVYLAERKEPHDQRVALKIIKPGMDSKAVIARFEQERQALAVMDHANVAKVFDAGSTPEGRPFFVMQYVKGEPITAYCDRHNLSIRQRLELFIPVCEAVQHAHHKGIIHRDISPSNILVSIVDGKPVPTVIDFGVAKAIAQTLTEEKTIFTQEGQIIGKPEYMSPEQAEMGALDVDTRTDVYSLGVLLYELLTGTLPFDSAELRAKGLDEIRRVIREVDPPTPSTKLTASGGKAVEIARQRQTQLDALARQLRIELEWIPMMAMRKDRTRRYASAEALGADIRRYLEGRPLEAAPESRLYLARKFLRRHRGPALAASLVVLTLVAGLAATLWQAGAEKERADQLKQVSDFQASMLAEVDPTEAGWRLSQDVIRKFTEALSKDGLTETERSSQVASFTAQWTRVNATDAARELIDATILKPAVAAIATQFKDQPILSARLQHVLAERYIELGLYEAAEPLQIIALETRRRELGEDHPDSIDSLHNLSVLLGYQGKRADAERYLGEALEKCRRVLGNDHPDTLTCVNSMGLLLIDQGRVVEAEPFFHEALEGRRRVQGEEHPDTLTAIDNMSYLLDTQGKFKEAQTLCQEALDKRRRVLGPEHPKTLVSLIRLSALLQALGRYDEAERCAIEVLEIRRRVRGEEHPETLSSINNMGLVLKAQNKLAQAEPYFREALEKRTRLLGIDHPRTLSSKSNLGKLLLDECKFEEAETLIRDALQGRRRRLGEEHPDVAMSMNDLANVLHAEGQVTEAGGLREQALAMYQRIYKGDHPVVATTLNNLARTRQDLGRASEAEQLFRQALEMRQRLFKGDHPIVASGLNNLGGARQDMGLSGEAKSLFRQALEMRQRLYKGDHADVAQSLNNLGRIDQDLGLAGEAEPLLQQSLEMYQRLYHGDQKDIARGLHNLSLVRLDLGRGAEAEQLCTQGLEMRRRLFKRDHPDLAGSLRRLAIIDVALDRPADAEPFARECLAMLERLFPDGDAREWMKYDAMSLLGDVIARQRRFEEAEPLLLTGWTGLSQDSRLPTPTLMPGSDFKGDAIDRIVRLYTAWNAAEPGKDYDARAAEWQLKLEVLKQKGESPKQDPAKSE